MAELIAAPNQASLGPHGDHQYQLHRSSMCSHRCRDVISSACGTIMKTVSVSSIILFCA